MNKLVNGVGINDVGQITNTLILTVRGMWYGFVQYMRSGETCLVEAMENHIRVDNQLM